MGVQDIPMHYIIKPCWVINIFKYFHHMEWGLGNTSITVFYIKVFEGPIANPPGAGFWEASAHDTTYQVVPSGEWTLAYYLVYECKHTTWCVNASIPPGVWIHAYHLVCECKHTTWCVNASIPPGVWIQAYHLVCECKHTTWWEITIATQIKYCHYHTS